MNRELLALLVCPACRGPLEYREVEQELVCVNDCIAFPVRDDIPVLLMMDARPLEPEDTEQDEHNKPADPL